MGPVDPWCVSDGNHGDFEPIGVLGMPARVASRLVKSIIAALKHDSAFLFSHDCVLLVRHLADGGEEEAAFKLAYELLTTARLESGKVPETTPGAAKRRYDTAWLLPLIGDWELRELIDKALPALVRLNGVKTVKLLRRKLGAAVSLMESVTAEQLRHGGETLRWCRRLDAVSEGGDPREVLAVALASVAAQVANDADKAHKVWKDLLCEGEIFQRVRWHLLASAGACLRDELDQLVGGDSLISPEFGAREAARLLRNQFGIVSPDSKQLFRYALERGPDLKTLQSRIESLRERRERTGAGPETGSSEEVATAANEWRARRVRWFHESIPAELEPLANALGVKPSVPDEETQDLDEVGWHSESGFSSSRDESPLSAEVLDSTSATELAAFLRIWTGPTETFGRGPSRDGLERELTSLGERTPEKALAVAACAEFQAVPLTYLGALLSGVHNASRDREIPWSEAIRLAMFAMTLASSREPRVEKKQVWREPRRFAAGIALELVRDGCHNSRVPVEAKALAWEFIGVALRAEVVWSENSEPTKANFGDVLSAALNSLSGSVAWTLVEVALWDYRERTESPGGSGKTEALIQTIEELVAPQLDHLLAAPGGFRLNVLAMLGQYVPQLILLAPDWVRRNEQTLFEGGAAAPLENPAWPAYLTRASFFNDVFQLLRPWYLKAAIALAERGESPPSADQFSPPQALVSHVLIAFLRGLVSIGDPDRLLEKAFSGARGKLKSHAYWEVYAGWRESKEPVPADFVERLVAFWEWRLNDLESDCHGEDAGQEVAGLLQFVMTPYVPAEDAIGLGRRTIGLLPKSHDPTRVAWERLAELATADAVGAYEVIEPLVERVMATKYPYLPYEKVAPVLRAVFRGANESVRLRARHLVHELGNQGHVEFGSLLKAEDASAKGD
jgi:hypothetical protein